MSLVTEVILLSGAYPLLRAIQANRPTTLRPALWWAAAAWLAWNFVVLAAIGSPVTAHELVGRYVALSLTGCAGVAVLGARRPGVAAWNFVVLGLLAVLLLPLAEQVVVGPRPLDWLRLVFVAGTLSVLVLNYLPTRLGLAAVLLAAGCGHELFLSMHPGEMAPAIPWGWLALALVPWVALASWRWSPGQFSELALLWRDFRDRFGLMWAQRVRDQFNRAAHHAGWPVVLGWRDLRPRDAEALLDAATTAEILKTLQALLKRFRTEDSVPKR
jgi:hypothetical protein